MHVSKFRDWFVDLRDQPDALRITLLGNGTVRDSVGRNARALSLVALLAAVVCAGSAWLLPSPPAARLVWGASSAAFFGLAIIVVRAVRLTIDLTPTALTLRPAWACFRFAARRYVPEETYVAIEGVDSGDDFVQYGSRVWLRSRSKTSRDLYIAWIGDAETLRTILTQHGLGAWLRASSPDASAFKD